jgi:hypothetical protein
VAGPAGGVDVAVVPPAQQGPVRLAGGPAGLPASPERDQVVGVGLPRF